MTREDLKKFVQALAEQGHHPRPEDHAEAVVARFEELRRAYFEELLTAHMTPPSE